FTFFGMAEKLQSVPKPLNGGPTNKDAAFQGISHLIADLPCDGSQQLVGGFNGFIPRVHYQKAPCAIGGFGHARLIAELTKKGRLLIARNTGYGYLGRKNVS